MPLGTYMTGHVTHYGVQAPPRT